jgi:two-component system, sensor histidine kinase
MGCRPPGPFQGEALNRLEERVVIVAPIGRDAAVATGILKEAGMVAVACPDLGALLAEIDRGAGVAVLTEEAVQDVDRAALVAWLAAQPPWSDFPFVLLTRQGGGLERNPVALQLMEVLGNVSFLERPFHPSTLVSVVRMALRARRRQYDARARLEELRKTRDAAKAAQRAAEQSDRAKSRFLAAASHDLRQPLQSLVLLAGALSMREFGASEHALVGEMQRSLSALKKLLDAILDISKLDAGIVAPQVREVTIGDVLERIRDEYRERAAQKSVEWRVARCRAVVRTDPALLERILRNLVENALRYTRQGKIVVGCRRRGDRLLVQVCDSGPGIPEDKRHEIFEEFTQLSNPERDRELGLGLGLAIVRRLSELLHHPVSLRSELGRGSAFTIDLPRARGGETPPAAGETERAARAAPGGAVLAIDDDAIVRAALVAMIEAWGHRVVAASSGDDALRQLNGGSAAPDVVIADYRLRAGETGPDAVQRVRRHLGRDVPAVVLTGDTSPAVLRDAHARGLRLLHKPVLPTDLRRALDEVAPHAPGFGHAAPPDPAN